MTTIQEIDKIASEFLYQRPLIENVAEICDGDLKVTVWILRLFVKAGGPIEMNQDCWKLLIIAAKEATKNESE